MNTYMSMRKYISVVLVILLLPVAFFTYAYAGFNDISEDEPYADVLLRMEEFGIMTGDSEGNFRPDDVLTREEFAKTILILCNLESTAGPLMGISIYSDVEPDRWSCGYINAAVNKGYISGKPDGTFGPEVPVTFAEVCTAMVKALGYKDTDLSGVWPKNYINKADELKITEGLELDANDPVTRRNFAIMADRLLVTNIKSDPSAKKTFASSIGLFTECIILGDSSSIKTLAANQVATDRGIYYLQDSDVKLETGNQYGLVLVDDTITRVYSKLRTIDTVTATKYLDKTVTYSTEVGQKEMVLPKKTVYYYKGDKIAYQNLDTILGVNSNIIFAWNKNKSGYEYAVILDPEEGSPALYNECIILGDFTTMENLSQNQVLTDKGIYYVTDPEISFEIGNTYGMAIEGDTIIMVYNQIKNLERVTVLKYIDNTVTYSTAFGDREMVLPEKTVYYYNGNKIAYGSLGSVLDVNSTIIFALNKNNLGYEYAVILDPVYSRPEIALNYNPDKMKAGGISLYNTLIVRNGELVEPAGIEELDVVYNVYDFYRTTRYVMVVSDKVEGELQGIYPNYISPKTIQVDGKTYEFSRYMNFSKISTVSSEFKKEDEVTLLLGRDGKVVDIYKKEFAWQETEIIITGTPKTIATLSENQIFTDKGVFYVAEGLEFTLGNKYMVEFDEDKIIKIKEELKTLTNITISEVLDNTITYGFPENKTMVLPEKTVYYYNGQRLSNYNSIRDLLNVNTSIIFAYNDEKTGYEYAILLDPVYSKPQVARDYQSWMNRVGDISLIGVRIIKNGEIIKADEIEDMDVVYEVSDYFGTSKYVLVVADRVEGEILGILPNKLSPRQVNLGGKIYNLSPDMNFDKVKSTSTSFKTGDEIIALLGYDGRVVDMLYEAAEEASDLAVVLNYHKTISTDLVDYGTVINYVKLLLANGQTVTWKVDEEPFSLKGTMVKYIKEDLDPDPEVEDIKVTLSQINIAGMLKEYTIDREEGKIGDSYVTDNVLIFNRIHNTANMDAEVDILRWDEMPNGTLKVGKIIYVNQAGEFGDVNLIFADDLFDEKYKYGVVTSIDLGTVCRVNMLINGVPYQFLSPERVSGEIGTVVKVEVINNNITKIVEWLPAAAQSTTIQAVDKKRVKIDDVIYPFTDGAVIYFKDSGARITVQGIKDIDTTKTYGKVSVYLDKPLDQKGKVQALVIYE
ncbi:MAG TPA: S-layer homology domain-containing protein [Clostridiaceae bacterium]|nr:S-layer homology domain-containing protein [Clostridiaceae bacterium]